MKTAAKNVIREESGKILILVLVLLVVGGLLLTPLLGLMSTGLASGQVYEKKTDELYAADAGVEEAVWRVANNLTGTGDPFVLSVNGKDVEYTIDGSGCGMGRSYTIRSIATTTGAGSTTVDVYLASSSFADNAITSRKDVTIQSNSSVYGNVQYGGDPKDSKFHGKVYEGEIINEKFAVWPGWGELYQHYYSGYVEAEQNFEYRSGNGQILVKDYPIGPLHWTGHLDIDNSSPQGVKGATLRLGGTLYVTGNLEFTQPGNNDYTVDLNGHTIFVEGSIDFPSNSVSVKGPGNIVAVESIDFKPNMSGDGYVLVLSLKGYVNFQPGGDFTGFIMSVESYVNFKPQGDFEGAVAGEVDVELLPGITLRHRSVFGAPIDFPFADYFVWRIRSYNIG